MHINDIAKELRICVERMRALGLLDDFQVRGFLKRLAQMDLRTRERLIVRLLDGEMQAREEG